MTQLYEFNNLIKFLPKPHWQVEQKFADQVLAEIYAGKLWHMDIVRNLPFALPFENRFGIIDKLMKEEKAKNTNVVKVLIHREQIFDDGFSAFKQLSNIDLKARLVILFID